MPKTRYCLEQDESSHWYLIPLDKREEFNKWNMSEAWEMGDAPEWAKNVGGPHVVSFTDPVEKY